MKPVWHFSHSSEREARSVRFKTSIQCFWVMKWLLLVKFETAIIPICSIVDCRICKIKNNTVAIQFTCCSILPLNLITTRKLFHVRLIILLKYNSSHYTCTLSKLVELQNKNIPPIPSLLSCHQHKSVGQQLYLKVNLYFKLLIHRRIHTIFFGLHCWLAEFIFYKHIKFYVVWSNQN